MFVITRQQFLYILTSVRFYQEWVLISSKCFACITSFYHVIFLLLHVDMMDYRVSQVVHW